MARIAVERRILHVVCEIHVHAVHGAGTQRGAVAKHGAASWGDGQHGT